MLHSIQVDVVIVGGGIAGLLLFRRLRNQGISVVLLEKYALGEGQTLASQGIIHGGSKYALQGKVNASATEVAHMTSLWAKYLRGEEVDLSRVKILSPHHYLWASGFGASLKTFISSKVLSSQNRVLQKSDYPKFFQDPGFTGSLCELDEVVLDVPSLIRELVGEESDQCLKISGELKIHWASETEIQKLTDEKGSFQAKHYVFLAGEGNEGYLGQIQSVQGNGSGGGACAFMQKRPLKMVMVKHPDLCPIYVHYVGMSHLPELTITSHQTPTGEWLWYLGGAIAEQGVHRTDAEQIRAAKDLLSERFAWMSFPIDFTQAVYGCLDIQRAEIFNQGKRPESFGLLAKGNFFMGWPTKLTLAPALVENLLGQLPASCQKNACTASSFQGEGRWIAPSSLAEEGRVEGFTLPQATFGKAPWENWMEKI